jgi:hypothetical protein
MTTRFDNLTLLQMVTAHMADAAALRELHDAIVQRWKVDNQDLVGKVYQVREGLYSGRRIWVRGLVSGWDSLAKRWGFSVHGPLERLARSSKRIGYAGGLYTSRHVQVPASRLMLATAKPPPDAD